MVKIVLASGSPRRQELLRRMGIADFYIRVPQVEERFPEGLTPEETVCYISREKSDAARLLAADSMARSARPAAWDTFCAVACAAFADC